MQDQNPRVCSICGTPGWIDRRVGIDEGLNCQCGLQTVQVQDRMGWITVPASGAYLIPLSEYLQKRGGHCR